MMELDLYSFIEFSEISDTKVRDYKLNAYSNCFPLIENLILCNKIVVEQKGVNYHNMGSICDVFSDAIKYIRDSRLYKETWQSSTHFIGKNILKRSLLYADVARDADIYYAPHPYREKTLSRKIPKYIDQTAKTVIRLFDQKFNESNGGIISNVNVKIPPVVEHVLFFSKTQKKTISESINEIRNSKNAQLFRNYFFTLDQELRDLSQRKKIHIYESLFRDIDKLCTVWLYDIDSEVRYRIRKINLSKIPMIGKLLGALGSDKFTIKDPILFAKAPYFLFINDLYR